MELYEEAADLCAQAAAAKGDRAPRKDDIEVIPQHLLVPAQGDPEMWAVRVKVRNLRYLSDEQHVLTSGEVTGLS